MAGKPAGGKKGVRPLIIIRKEEVVEGGHHGGAWKVAYADFVTAMMAFFLLMWLLNATTEEQRKGLADYFSPSNVLARSPSGFGAPFGGLTPNVEGSLASDRGAVQMVKAPTHPLVESDEDEGDVPARATALRQAPGPALTSTGEDGRAARQPPAFPDAEGRRQDPATAPRPLTGPASGAASTTPSEAELQAELEKREKAAFEKAAEQIREAVRQDPALAELAKQLTIELTPEGLRIQIMDEDRRPMFPTGSAVLNERARALLAKVAPVLMRLPEPIAIAGHTDATPYRGADRTNWDLSADRANATRRLLVESGLPEERMRSVAGYADREPLVPADRFAAGNRRIAIVVLRDRAALLRTAPGGAN